MMAGRPSRIPPEEVLVLLPAPIFQSLYRYRANLTAFGVFTSLGRLGIQANMAFTAAGEKLITLDEIKPYRLVILGSSTYRKDFNAVPEILLEYVKQGGNLFLPLAKCDSLVDPYLKVRTSPALKELAGCKSSERVEKGQLAGIKALHPSFGKNLPDTWSLEMTEPATFTKVELGPGAEVLAEGNGEPLLYRHKIGQGTVYVYTWNLDVFIYDGGTLDHHKDAWDWLWQGIASELGLQQRLDSPLCQTILEMMV
jgi:hypothetical protein